MQNDAYLELFVGCMYAQKTSKLIDIYWQYTFCNVPIMAINYSGDNRYDANNSIVTHDGRSIPCIKTDTLLDLCNHPLITNANVVLINEGQFFNDLVPFVHQLISLNKKIYVCGLDGDFERNKFGTILDLIPICDKVTKLTALCELCKNGTPGIFSKRLSHETDQTVIGGTEKYMAVCRKCY